MAKIYIAEVRKIGGEDQAGYVAIRKYGHEDDETEVKDEDLSWGVPIQPVTSAATGRLGSSPHGLRVTSRVIVTYADNDPEEKHPLILGSFARSAPEAEA
jgi:hypothetical protein